MKFIYSVPAQLKDNIGLNYQLANVDGNRKRTGSEPEANRKRAGSWFSQQKDGDDAQNLQDNIFGFVVVRIDITGQILG